MIDVYEQFLTAVVESDVKEVRRLIENGLELNKRCDQGASALFGAILHGDPIIIRLMLEHGADPNLIADEPAYNRLLCVQARYLVAKDLPRGASLIPTNKKLFIGSKRLSLDGVG